MLFEKDPFMQTVRAMPFWIACLISTVIFAFISTKLRTIRPTLAAGFLIYTASYIAFATLQPNQSTRSIIYDAFAGLGYGAPLVLVFAGVQLATPHHLIATASAVTCSFRAVFATIFAAVYTAVVDDRQNRYLPIYVTQAALEAGLPETSLDSFIKALIGNDPTTDLQSIAGASSSVIAASTTALQQAYADAVRVVWIIAASVCAFAFLACFFLGDLGNSMNYHVDAPVENLVGKHEGERQTKTA